MLYWLAIVCMCVGLVAGDSHAEPPPAPECGYGCMNGAECSWSEYDEDYMCGCHEGFTGHFCETRIPDCSAEGCYNGGTCLEADNLCECAEGYTGRQCETMILRCQDFGCDNGGTCDVYADFDTCECKEGFTGPRCEERLPQCYSCSPHAEPCEYPPCECQGNCYAQEMTHCYKCDGLYGEDCHMNPGYLETTECMYGCQTARYTTDEYDYISRGCAEQACWAGCGDMEEADGKQCFSCCYDESCNTDTPSEITAAGAIVGIGTITVTLTFLMAIVFA